jgi:hypothetical protein
MAPVASSSAACAGAHRVARIGDARSTLDDGVLSHVNACAAGLGLAVRQRPREALSAL